ARGARAMTLRLAAFRRHHVDFCPMRRSSMSSSGSALLSVLACLALASTATGGNVIAQVKLDTLIVKGSSDADSIALTQGGSASEIVITPNGGTLLNG